MQNQNQNQSKIQTENDNQPKTETQDQKQNTLSKVNRVFAMPLVTAVLMLVSADFSGIAVNYFTANKTEKAVQDAVLKQLTAELELESDNRSLAEAILEIKDEKDELTNELNTANSQLEALTDSSEGASQRLDELNEELSTYVFYSPDVAVDGLSVSTNKDSLLDHNGRLYYDDSIIKHFFSDEQIIWKDNHLDFNTEGSVVTINPQLKNAVNLTTMEVTSPNEHIHYDPKADNSNKMHHDVMYTWWSGTQYIEYRLDREYRWFDCGLFVTKTAANNSYDSDIWNKASVSITADNGIVLWGSETISRDAEIQYSGLIDISEVKYIRITFYNASVDNGSPYIVIDKPKLYLE